MLDNLIKEELSAHFGNLSDNRVGQNKSYTIKEIVSAAFSVFFLQSHSFLEHQERLKKKNGKHNGLSLFGFDAIPSDNQIRNVGDGIKSNEFEPLYKTLHDKINLERDGFNFMGGILVPLDGTEFFSSQKISCKCCLKRDKDGKTRYVHQMLCPAVVHPQKKMVFPLAPEFITNKDGNTKQDCEINAAKRWVDKNAPYLQKQNAILLGDDLYSHGPFCNKLFDAGLNFVFVCKDESHTYLKEWMTAFDKEDWRYKTCTEKMGNAKQIFQYRFANSVPLSSCPDTAPEVGYVEMTVTNRHNKVIYKNSFITSFTLTEDNVHDIATAGRSRWNIENGVFNILKNHGYHLEHNFGHGEENLSNTLACLNLIAFLVHSLAQLFDAGYQLLQQRITARYRFFQNIAALLIFITFKSWNALFTYMNLALEEVQSN